MNRRTFLGTITAATLLSNRFASTLAFPKEGDAGKIDKIGVQLYTVRQEMKKDFEGTLSKVAEIGYREVEFAGYFEHAPKDVRAVLDRHGLAAPSTHIGYPSLAPDKWPGVLEDSKVIGHAYIVNPSVEDDLQKTADGWKRAAETFNRVGEASKKVGIQFAYHNHDHEFRPVDGKLPYDILLTECDQQLVKMEMDLGWAFVAGADPLTYFAKYPGRFPLVHVKDFTKDKKMKNVGSGAIDWKRIFASSDKGGIKHYFVENDNPTSAFDDIRSSFEYLQKLRF
ncbi:MAG: sugar phosphate isomerase/epimerase [Terriglobales bacterium]